MLAPRELPPEFLAWNHKYGAPSGHTDIPRWKRKLMSTEAIAKLRGPFAIQKNNSIRRFEYPWAFQAAELKSGLRVLELGGGLSGFQFALALNGCSVLNVDPGSESMGWPCNQESMRKLNERFGTRVELQNSTIEKAALPAASFDRAYSISVIEHLPEAAVSQAMESHSPMLEAELFLCTYDRSFFESFSVLFAPGERVRPKSKYNGADR